MDEEILSLAVALSGGEADPGERLRLLCRGARRELRGRLRAGVEEEDCADEFALGAALLALADFYEGGGEDVKSFTAGALTVHLGDRARSGALRRRAQAVMSPYLLDGRFCFQGVRG